jgi:hypothetical protein
MPKGKGMPLSNRCPSKVSAAGRRCPEANNQPSVCWVYESGSSRQPILILKGQPLQASERVFQAIVMPEHIHHLLSDIFADALKSLKQGVVRRLIGDADHFWQKRYYYNSNVRNHAQFVEKLPYIHCDAVRWNCPTQAKIGLEWATRHPSAVQKEVTSNCCCIRLECGNRVNECNGDVSTVRFGRRASREVFLPLPILRLARPNHLKWWK